MGYDLYLNDPVSGETLEVGSKHVMSGGVLMLSAVCGMEIDYV